jgi:cytochrome P450
MDFSNLNTNDLKTPVSMSIPFILQDPSIFPDPHTFDAERWIRSTERGDNLERFQITFAKGSRPCPGQK